MASSLPSPTKVAGKHHQIYEAYYKQVDPKGIGTIEALVAAKFLKKSGLSDVVLSRIWDLSDPTGKGYLDKAGLFVALKLVALAQSGETINMANIFLDPPNPPKVGEIPKIMPAKIQSVPPTNDDWSIKTIDRLKYEELFESLQPSGGLLPGAKVRGVLMESKLPLDALSKIWDLADQDRDGSLDKHEFIVAMHLVYLALDKRAVPQALPAELQRSANKTAPSNDGFVANFPKDIGPPPAVPPLPAVLQNNMPPAIPPMPQVSSRQNSVPLISMDALMGSPPPTNDWVVTPADRVRYDKIFATSDADKDGLVSGGEIKDVFLQSGIPQMCLAQIWALCDTNQSGKLTSEQFALAMWFVERKKSGIEPPNALAPNMVPPTLRTNAAPAPATASVLDNLIGDIPPIQPIEPQRPVYDNPELEMIAKEIEELAKERRQLENDVVQKEADIRIKNGEVRNLQSELDTLVATLKQLESQKGEAQKRLNDLKAQVTKIREQCQKQEETIREQESELDSKRGELQQLKDEESSLEKEYDENKTKFEKLSKTLQDTQLQISQIKAFVTQLEENQRQMNDALVVCKSAIDNNDPTHASYYSLKIEPEFREAKTALEAKQEPVEDAFNDKRNSFSNGTSEPKFATTFDDQSSGFGAFDDGFGNNFSNKAKNDPFASSTNHDPFGDKRGSSAQQFDSNKDDFGSDPFAILHAPTSASQGPSGSNLSAKTNPPPRPESPSPALPPKIQKKQPPPRPAPPRPLQGPSAGNTSAGSGFANFADFDNKNAGLNDFSEDPFKDYRYEDPFNIEDPFADEEGKNKANKRNGQSIKLNGSSDAKTKPICDAFDDNSNNQVQNGKTTWNNNNNDVENRNQKNASTPPTLHMNENGNIVVKSSQALTTSNGSFGDFEFPATNDVDFFADFNNTFTQKTKQTAGDTVDAFGLGLNATATPIEAALDDHTDGCLGNLSHKSAFITNYTALTNDTHIWNNGNKIFTDDHFDDKFGSLITNTASTTTNTSTNDINMNSSKIASMKSLGFDDSEISFADFDNAFDAFKTASTTPKKPTTRVAAIFPTKHGNDIARSASASKDVTDTASADAVDPTGEPLNVSKKFLHDYSKTDDFESDLQLVMQRSVVDQ